MRKTTNGFTIVELLIVIVVIAILAAISAVAYNGIQTRARTAAHQHAASQAEREIMTYALQQNGESISLSNTLVGYKEGAGDISLLRPITGMQDITMYGVYAITGTASGWNAYARLTPYIAGNGFLLQTGTSGSSAMSFRIDTSAEASIGGTASGFRIPGNTVIGWLQASNGAMARAYGYNQAVSHASSALASHTGWNFTGLTLTTGADGVPRVGLVFNAAHDQATRQQVISWLAQKYGVSL